MAPELALLYEPVKRETLVVFQSLYFVTMVIMIIIILASLLSISYPFFIHVSARTVVVLRSITAAGIPVIATVLVRLSTGHRISTHVSKPDPYKHSQNPVPPLPTSGFLPFLQPWLPYPSTRLKEVNSPIKRWLLGRHFPSTQFLLWRFKPVVWLVAPWTTWFAANQILETTLQKG